MRRKPKMTVHERLRRAGPGGRDPTAREISASLRTLQDAGQELDDVPFRIWTYLVNADLSILDYGIGNLAKEFGLSRAAMGRALGRLEDAGYVELVRGRKFTTTTVRIKIAMLSQHHNHVYKVGPTAFTLPKPRRESRKLPTLRVFDQADLDGRRRKSMHPV